MWWDPTLSSLFWGMQRGRQNIVARAVGKFDRYQLLRAADAEQHQTLRQEAKREHVFVHLKMRSFTGLQVWKTIESVPISWFE
jgi:hypothetical protein